MELVSLASIPAAPPMTVNGPRNAAPARIKTIIDREKDFVLRRHAVRRHFIKVRGGFKGTDHRAYPHTTNADVKQLATVWSKELSRVKAQSAHDRTEHRRWRACVAFVAKNADPKRPAETFGHNERFWGCTLQLAIYLQSRKGRPSKWTLFRESLVESLVEVPSTIGSAAGAVANTASDAAGAVAGALSMPAKVGIAALAGIALGPPLIRSVRK